MIEDHQSHCIQYLKITMKTRLIDAIAVRKSRRFWGVFLYRRTCKIIVPADTAVAPLKKEAFF